MSRQLTIEVLRILEWANDNLARTDAAATEDYKRAICSMIEDILFESKNYCGFRIPVEGENGYHRQYNYSSDLKVEIDIRQAKLRRTL
jgi:hypothetical protein